MFNDSLNVRVGNQRRKQAMAKVAAKMMQNRGRSSGLVGAARAGGGLGKQNMAKFRPLAGRNMGALARLLGGGGGLSNMEQAIGRFGITERQPGAMDPGAIPDIGGISGSVGSEAAPGDFGVGLGPSGGQAAPLPQSNQPQLTPEQNSMVGSTPGATLGQVMPPGFIPNNTPRGGNGGAPIGYVMWQGQLIPSGVFRAMQQTGELYG